MLALGFGGELSIEHDNTVDFRYAGAGGLCDLLHGFKRNIAQFVLDLMKHFDAGTRLISVPGNDLIDFAKRIPI